jgi:hypothetical protein
MWQHFSLYERCASFTLTFIVANSTHNDLAPVMLASHGFAAQEDAHTEGQLHTYKAERNLRGVQSMY